MSPSDEKSSEDRSPEEIEAEIAETRQELGETVADIADKADVKKQAGRKAEELKSQAREKLDQAKAAALGQPTGGTDGTGGDIGSGPTGDVRNSPGIAAAGGPSRAVVIAAAAFITGLVLGRLIWR